jgi:alcohol dehydrogenase
MRATFETVPRIVFGSGSLAALGEELGRLGGRRILLVSDPGIERAGILAAARAVLGRAGIDHTAFLGVEPEPRIETAAAAAAAARACAPDAVVGIGGGSVLDIAKAAALLPANPGPVEDFLGMERVPRPGAPLVLVPTTAGTGSEMTSICVLSDPRGQVKQAIVSKHLFARVALLDPELTLGLPPAVTAATGMDALVHAVESFVGVRASDFSDALNRQAIALIAANLERAFADGGDLAARAAMLNAAGLAGLAFANTQNGLAHALALAIGGRFHLPHGLLTAALLPAVMAFNLRAAPAKFAEIARLLGEPTAGLSEAQAAQRSIARVRGLLGRLGISERLGSYGIPAAEYPAIARGALGAARLIANNPRPVTAAEVIALLEETA